MKTERRFLNVAELRVSRADDKPDKIKGYAARFNTLSEDLGGFREKIDPGAFSKSLAGGADVRALVNHDPNLVLGRNTAGTLNITENKTGLKVAITPPDTQAGRDITTSIERGDIDGMSFGFRTITDKWERVDDEEIRTLKEVELHDVSAVTYPAYADTSVAVRSLDAHKESIKPKVLETQKMRLELAEIDSPVLAAN